MDGDNEPRFGGISGRRWLFRDICIGGHRGWEENMTPQESASYEFQRIFPQSSD